jgi:CubicO group peptidase (beta-lactamase class C family)
MHSQQIPGVAFAVVSNGRIEFLRTYGYANLEHRVPVRSSTVFQSGSLAKQFTAAAVMLLVDDGKITLDEPIRTYLADAPPEWNQITVRRLLDHTAGLGNFGDEVDLRRDYTEAEFWELIKKSPLKFEPGTDWDYSNNGYVTLGILIRKVAGEFYGDLLTRRIFKPLGMRRSRVISEEDIIPDRADGYHLVGGKLKNQEWVSPSNNTTADGSLYLTLADLIRWDAALTSGSLFRPSALETIWSPARLTDGREWPYGFGWHLGTIGNRKIVFHGGAWQGFKSIIVRVLDDKRTFILLANSWDTHEFRLAQNLLSFYYPELHPPKVKFVEDIYPKETEASRGLLMRVLRGATPLNNSFQGDRPHAIRNLLRSMSIPVAVIYTSELVSSESKSDRRTMKYLLSDVLKSWVLTVEFTSDGFIRDLRLEPA